MSKKFTRSSYFGISVFAGFLIVVAFIVFLGPSLSGQFFSSCPDTWTKVIVSSNKGADAATGVAVTPDGSSVYVSGNYGNAGESAINNFWISRFNYCGEKVWTQDLHELIPIPVEGGQALSRVAVDRDNRFVYVVGYFTVNFSKYYSLVAKLDALDGRVEWSSIIEGGPGMFASSYLNGVAVDGVGNIFVIGRANNNSFSGNRTILFAKFTPPAIDPVWMYQYKSPFVNGNETLFETGANLFLSSDGYAYLAGTITVPGRSLGAPEFFMTRSAAWIAKIKQSSGSIVWSRNYSSDYSVWATDIASRSDGRPTLFASSHLGQPILLLNYNNYGDLEFVQPFSVPGAGVRGAGMDINSINTVAFTGSVWPHETDPQIFVKLLPGWMAVEDGLLNTADEGQEIAFDNARYVYAVGFIVNDASNWEDIWIRKYSPDGR